MSTALIRCWGKAPGNSPCPSLVCHVAGLKFLRKCGAYGPFSVIYVILQLFCLFSWPRLGELDGLGHLE